MHVWWSSDHHRWFYCGRCCPLSNCCCRFANQFPSTMSSSHLLVCRALSNRAVFSSKPFSVFQLFREFSVKKYKKTKVDDQKIILEMTKFIIKTKLKSITHISPHSNRNWNWENVCERASEEFAVNKSEETKREPRKFINCANENTVKNSWIKKFEDEFCYFCGCFVNFVLILGISWEFWWFWGFIMGFLCKCKGIFRYDVTRCCFFRSKPIITTWRYMCTVPTIYFFIFD